MKEFSDIESFVAHLAGVAETQVIMARKALDKCAQVVEKRAKEKIGEYQDEAGPFTAWAELSENTLYGGYANGIRYPGKIELGYATEDEHNPLLRTGEMRDSISHVVSASDLEAQIGSNSDIAVYQELGTEHMPPRSFLGGAMVDSLPKIDKILVESLVGAISATNLSAALLGDEVVAGGIRIK